MHPAPGAYEKIAMGILSDIANGEARYTNPARQAVQQLKKPRLDLSLERNTWVSGCTAALRAETRCGPHIVIAVRKAPRRCEGTRARATHAAHTVEAAERVAAVRVVGHSAAGDTDRPDRPSKLP